MSNVFYVDSETQAARKVSFSAVVNDETNSGEYQEYKPIPKVKRATSVSHEDDLTIWPSVMAAVIVSLGAISGGFVLGFSSPTGPQLQADGLIVTEEQSSWYSSIATLSAAMGGLLSGFMSDRLGRKCTIMVSTVTANVGWLVLTASTNFIGLCIARFLTGLTLGMVCVAIPTYIAEIACSRTRGLLSCGLALGISLGIFLAFALGMLISWQWLAVCGSCISGLLSVLLLLIPESPRWLMAHSHKRASHKALQWLYRDAKHAQQAYNVLQNNLSRSENDGTLRWSDFRQPGLSWALFLCIGMMMFMQFGGINAVLFNSHSIFEISFPNNPELVHMSSLAIAGTQVLSSIVQSLLIDRCGRRALMIFSGIGMCTSMAAMGAYYFFEDKHTEHVNDLDIIAVVSLIIYMASYSIGFAGIPFMVTSEIFPSKARGTAGAIGTVVSWMSSFIVTNQFQNMRNTLNRDGTFWLFSGINFVGVIFISLCVPETKGRTLEEIQAHFTSKRRRSTKIKFEHESEDSENPSVNTEVARDSTLHRPPM